MIGSDTARVKDVMSHDVVLIGKDADVHELQRMFIEKRIHGAPVVDDDGQLVGVVSQTDLLLWHHETGVDGTAFYHEGDVDVPALREGDPLRVADIRTARVADVMTPVVHVIDASSRLRDAADRMLETSVHRLIVVDGDGAVCGILSAMDLLRHVARSG